MEGVVEFGMKSDSEDSEVRDLFDNLSEDAIKIKDGAKPNLILSIVACVGGLAILGFMLMGLASKSGA